MKNDAASGRQAPERWVVYATFDTDGAVAPFAVDQLKAYRALGFETLLIDTSSAILPERTTSWEACSKLWRRRDNRGYDFGSYRAGLRMLLEERGLATSRLDVLFTNDSCYGSFEDVFRRFNAYPRDGRHVFGLTETHQLSHHLQSRWLYFCADVLPLAADFFAVPTDLRDRSVTVAQGEIGLSTHLLAHGCKPIAYRPMQALVAHFAAYRPRLWALLELDLRWRLKRLRYSVRGGKVCLKFMLGRPYICNPTIAFGTHLCFDGLMPLFKRQLVRENLDHDPFAPEQPPSDPRDNRTVDRWLRSTERYRRRDGH